MEMTKQYAIDRQSPMPVPEGSLETVLPQIAGMLEATEASPTKGEGNL